MNKRASVGQALGIFVVGLVAYLGLRWGGFEPYVIPSGSMIPSLLIYDHIIVNKSAYGLRWPFSGRWIFGPKTPERGEVVVFRSVENPDFFMVKRVVGLPGETLKVSADGSLKVNGQIVDRKPISFVEAQALSNAKFEASDLNSNFKNINHFFETFAVSGHLVQQIDSQGEDSEFQVPEGHIFLMGDNRDRSQDSRFWGPLPLTHLLGQAKWIWLSCAEAVSGQQILCNPSTVRWARVFKAIQ